MTKKRIENVISETLKGDAQRNALEFADYLRENGIELEDSENYWEVKHKNKTLCFIWINGSDQLPGPWTVWSDQEQGSWTFWDDESYKHKHKNYSVDENTKEVAWANVNFCTNCGGTCSPGKRKTILGKDFDNLCSSAMAFTNPDSKTLDCVKKMITIRKSDILEYI